MKKIKLTQNQFTIINNEDFEYLSQWSWRAIWNQPTQSYYAITSVYKSNDARSTARMHRFILGLDFGDKRQGDHKNHNTLDNRRSNLRIVTRRGNGANLINQSKYGVGVRFQKGRKSKPFQAYTWLNGRQLYIGMFATAKEARAARKLFLKQNNLR